MVNGLNPSMRMPIESSRYAVPYYVIHTYLYSTFLLHICSRLVAAFVQHKNVKHLTTTVNIHNKLINKNINQCSINLIFVYIT